MGDVDALSTARIVLVVPVLDFGGVESRVVLQAKAMASRFQDFRVCCFTDDGLAAEQVRQLGVPVDVLGVRPTVRNPLATYRLWRYLRRHRPDIVHACTGAMTVQAMLASTAVRVPIRICEEVGIPTRGRLGRLLFPLLYRLATHVIGVSDAVVAYLISEDGVPPSKAHRIYNTIDDDFFEVRPAPRDGAFRIMTVGRLARDKNQALLIRASAQLLQEDESAVLTIVGDGPLRRDLADLAEGLGISRSVEFLGRRSDVAALLSTADLFVLPSSSEGFGLALVEAMAASVPVIATAVGGVPEILDTVAPEWVVAAGDDKAMSAAIRRAATMPVAARRELGSRLSQHARKHFAADRYVAALAELYTEALEVTAITR